VPAGWLCEQLRLGRRRRLLDRTVVDETKDPRAAGRIRPL
jgi:hypothetical protein